MKIKMILIKLLEKKEKWEDNSKKTILEIVKESANLLNFMKINLLNKEIIIFKVKKIFKTFIKIKLTVLKKLLNPNKNKLEDFLSLIGSLSKMKKKD